MLTHTHVRPTLAHVHAPLASAGPLGMTTLIPGMCVKKASGDWEW